MTPVVRPEDFYSERPAALRTSFARLRRCKAALLPALRGKLAFCPALLTRHWLPEVELVSGILTEL